MTAERRKQISVVLFVISIVACGIWVYTAGRSVLDELSGRGSGGIAGVSGGIAESVVEGFVTVVPVIVTLVLTRISGSTRLARNWRNAHLASVLALIIVPMMGGLRLMLVSIAVFLPVQLFFVIGSIVIWFARPRPQTSTPENGAQ